MKELRLVASYNAIGMHGGTQHLAEQGNPKTLCGRDRSNWMDMRKADLPDLDSAWTCRRCQKKWAEMPVQ